MWLSLQMEPHLAVSPNCLYNLWLMSTAAAAATVITAIVGNQSARPDGGCCCQGWTALQSAKWIVTSSRTCHRCLHQFAEYSKLDKLGQRWEHWRIGDGRPGVERKK